MYYNLRRGAFVMVDVFVYEDNKLLFRYESPMSVNIGECIEFGEEVYKIIAKTYVVDEGIFDISRLACLKLNVIQVED